MIIEDYWTAYQKGYDAWNQCKGNKPFPENPYEKDSEFWFAWNRGFNLNDNYIDYKNVNNSTQQSLDFG